MAKRKYKPACPICRAPRADHAWCAACKEIGRAVARALSPRGRTEAGDREAVHRARVESLPPDESGRKR